MSEIPPPTKGDQIVAEIVRLRGKVEHGNLGAYVVGVEALALLLESHALLAAARRDLAEAMELLKPVAVQDSSCIVPACDCLGCRATAFLKRMEAS